MTTYERVLDNVADVLVANTIHYSDTMKEDISAFVIEATYNFNPVALTDTDTIANLWMRISKIHAGELSNWFLSATARYRAANGLYDNMTATSASLTWTEYCTYIATCLDIAPVPNLSLLDRTLISGTISTADMSGILVNNPWLAFYMSIYLSTNIPAKLIK